MTISTHAVERLGRFLGHASRIADKLALAALVETLRDPVGSFALVLDTVPFTGVAWSDESNGDLAVAIVRDGEVKTVMLRRRTQPLTPKALRVDRVIAV